MSDYNLGMHAIGLQVAYDTFHANQMESLTQKARKNNRELADITECLSELYARLKENPDGVHNLKEIETLIDRIRTIYTDMKETYKNMEGIESEEFRHEECPFPEDFSEITSDQVEKITQKLESLRTRKQNDLPEIMTEIQKCGQLLLAVVEIMKHSAKIDHDGKEVIIRNMSRI